AYDVLGDAEKRKSYDQVREMSSSGFGGGFPGGGFGGFPGAGGQRVRVEGFNVEDLGDLGDLFGGLFGGIGGRGRRGRRAETARGSDLETEVRVSFDDAMRGTTVPVKIRGAAPCQTCGGSGAAP